MPEKGEALAAARRRALRGDVAAAIISAREARGWTQKQLGEALGVSQATVAGWEGSGSFPGGETLIRIAEATGTMLLAPARSDATVAYRRALATITARLAAMEGEGAPQTHVTLPVPQGASRPGRRGPASADGSPPGSS